MSFADGEALGAASLTFGSQNETFNQLCVAGQAFHRNFDIDISRCLSSNYWCSSFYVRRSVQSRRLKLFLQMIVCKFMCLYLFGRSSMNLVASTVSRLLPWRLYYAYEIVNRSASKKRIQWNITLSEFLVSILLGFSVRIHDEPFFMAWKSDLTALSMSSIGFRF